MVNNIISTLITSFYTIIDIPLLHLLCYGISRNVSGSQEYAAKSSMIVRNIRYRYPITSEQINDTYDEVYNDLVDILGYYNTTGVLSVSGSLRELWDDVDIERKSILGYNASGYTEALSFASGTSSHIMSDLSNIEMVTNSFFNNRV